MTRILSLQKLVTVRELMNAGSSASTVCSSQSQQNC